MNAQEYYATPESLLPTELRTHALGRVSIAPLDVVLDEVKALIVQPDVFYIANGRDEIVGRRVNGPPDRVVEVLSPQPRVGDLERRFGWFARYGVRECWAYHQTEQRLEIVTFVDGAIAGRTSVALDNTLDSPCLPEFTFTLRQVLDRLHNGANDG